MKGRGQYTPEQIDRILGEHQGGVAAKEITSRHGMSLDVFHHQRRKCSGLGKFKVQRLKALEDQKRRPKRILADQALNFQLLKNALPMEW
jgi:putative transposase